MVRRGGGWGVLHFADSALSREIMRRVALWPHTLPEFARHRNQETCFGAFQFPHLVAGNVIFSP